MIDIHALAEQAVHVLPIDAIEGALRRDAGEWGLENQLNSRSLS